MVESTQDVTGVSAPSHCSPSRVHLDLFSGIGGFALAAKWNGLQTIGFSEIEPYACKILKRHWPEVPNFGDIRNVTREVVADAARLGEREPPNEADAIATGGRARHESRNGGEHAGTSTSLVDLITGGFPCQPFSVAGKQRGAKDDRHLWPEMCRVIAEARPAWVLGENVPGIIGMALDGVLTDLEHLGYSCWPVVVPACAVDARHRRDRVWIVGWNADSMRCRWNGREKRTFQNENTDANRVREAVADVRGTESGGIPSIGRQEISAPRRDGKNMADAASKQTGGIQQRPIPANSRAGSHRPSEAACWPTEPGVGRVVNGLPNRTHRLKGLGNAIVPQVAANLIRWMLESEMIWMGNHHSATPVADPK